jgi:hypothetical protein
LWLDKRWPDGQYLGTAHKRGRLWLRERRAWREHQIGQFLKEVNLAAAFLHRDWLIAEMVLSAGK